MGKQSKILCVIKKKYLEMKTYKLLHRIINAYLLQLLAGFPVFPRSFCAQNTARAELYPLHQQTIPSFKQVIISDQQVYTGNLPILLTKYFVRQDSELFFFPPDDIHKLSKQTMYQVKYTKYHLRYQRTRTLSNFKPKLFFHQSI